MSLEEKDAKALGVNLIKWGLPRRCPHCGGSVGISRLIQEMPETSGGVSKAVAESVCEGCQITKVIVIGYRAEDGKKQKNSREDRVCEGDDRDIESEA
jgi:hypothetical protein